MLTSILCRLSNGPPLSLRNGLQVLMKTRVFLFRPSDFVLQYSLITNLCFCIYVCTHSSELFCFVRTLLCPYFASAFHFVRMAFFHFVVMYGTLWSLTPIVLTSACLPTLFFINVFQWKNWSSTSLKIPLMCQGVRDNSWLQKVSWACLILSYAENESVIT